ncbi:microneme associated antigen, putative (MA) [Plasmodium ovale wallikeri]|uniref:Microneme associated antigen, putative (MA) n=1 Tax=Plasmodium ovale wallikeri TaxID=864142 RepID=A0A1A8YRZ0_PLAOA|nr:microneme associated antigen, putative (MA) [Plasmodium ovale wallikeri]SBT34858.1 microneme associated antigen, putative (MA) [Plasmodium ovale wallikeri]
MHTDFAKSKFNLLSGGLFANMYKRGSSYLREVEEKGDEGNDPLQRRSAHLGATGKVTGMSKTKDAIETNEPSRPNWQNRTNRPNWQNHPNWPNHPSGPSRPNEASKPIEEPTSVKNVDQMHKLSKQLIYSYYNNFVNAKVEDEEEEEEGGGIGGVGGGVGGGGGKRGLMSVYSNSGVKSNLSDYQNGSNINDKMIFSKNSDIIIKEEDIFYDEFKKLKSDVLALQIMNVHLQKHVLANHVLNTSKMPQHFQVFPVNRRTLKGDELVGKKWYDGAAGWRDDPLFKREEMRGGDEGGEKTLVKPVLSTST